MDNTSKKAFVSLICALTLILVQQAAWACQVDEFYNTKEGSLAATTPEILNEAEKYEEDNKDKLAALLGNRRS